MNNIWEQALKRLTETSDDEVHVPSRLDPKQEELIERFADRLTASLGGPIDERHIGICEKILRELLVRSEMAGPIIS